MIREKNIHYYEKIRKEGLSMNKADLKFLRKAGFNIAFGVIVGKELGDFVTQVAYGFAKKMMDKNKTPESNKAEE